MRLIYLNVCEDELFSDIGVNFTDDYLVSVVDKSQIIIKKNECFNKNSIYGEKMKIARFFCKFFKIFYIHLVYTFYLLKAHISHYFSILLHDKKTGILSV